VLVLAVVMEKKMNKILDIADVDIFNKKFLKKKKGKPNQISRCSLSHALKTVRV
jgi:hypothetical protein